MSLLMAGGNAVCGSSAIASIAPAIQADEEEKGQIITLVNLLGTVLMLTLPILSGILYGTNLLARSALIGGLYNQLVRLSPVPIWSMRTQFNLRCSLKLCGLSYS